MEQNAAHIIVISDGQIGDQTETAAMATQAIKRLEGKLISASLLRLKTSQHAQPDTRAMSCIGQFCNNAGGTAVLDIECHGSDYEVGLYNLTTAIAEGCSAAGVGTAIELRADQPIFRLTPTAAPVASIMLPCSDVAACYVLMTELRDSLTLGGVVYPIVDAGVPKTVDELETFIHFITQPLKIRMLAGGRNDADLKKLIEETLGFLEQIEAMILSVQMRALESDHVDLSVAGRARNIVKSIKGSIGSIISQLRQELNVDRVAGLNAQQTADFLRPIGASKTGRALARRAGETDLSSDSSKGIKALATTMRGPNAPKDDDGSLCSFYSLSNFYQCINTSQELDGVSANMRWLECLGGVGVPFSAQVRDYPMPWNLRLTNLYMGQVLAEPDVFLACVQAGSNTGAIECPGQPGKQITGVIVLQDIDPDSFKAYNSGPARELALMQCSAQIRHTVACMPYDDIALNTAGIWWILNHYGSQDKLASVEMELFKSLMNNVRVLIGEVYRDKTVEKFREIYNDLLREDPRPWISGDRDFADVLQGVAALIRFGAPDANYKPAMRALYSLEAYQAMKRKYKPVEGGSETRETALHQLLQIDFQAHGTLMQPLFIAEPDKVSHYGTVIIEGPIENDNNAAVSPNRSGARMPKCMPWMTPYFGLYRSLVNADNLPTAANVFGCDDLEVFKTAIAVQSLLSTEESVRIDTATRVSHLVDISSPDAARAYLTGVQTKIYEEEYKKRVAIKVKEENRILTERAVKDLVSTKTMEEFVLLLQNCVITNRDHVGFEPLLRQVSGVGDCPDRLRKLVVLLTGRTPDNIDVAVWATGNFYAGKWKQMGALFNQTPGGPELWKTLMAIYEKYGIYKYPRGTTHNRHGHGDDFPSYWALGFKDLADMQSKVPADIFRDYVRAHCIANKCCLPNENERKGFGI